MHIERKRRAGACNTTPADRLRGAMTGAKTLGELFPLVVMLLQWTEGMMNGRKLGEDDIQRIVVPLTRLRLLLTRIAPPARGAGHDDWEDTFVKALVERCRDIEGRIKEIRNDLAREKKTHVP